MPPPQGPLCDPVWTSLTLCEALHAYFLQKQKCSLIKKKSHTGLRLSVQVNKLIFNDLNYVWLTGDVISAEIIRRGIPVISEP